MRWLVVLRWLPVALGAAHVVLFAAIATARFAHPIELEWMSGAVWDHIARVGRGEPLYVAPSDSFIPFLYPPLHYWLSALVAHAMPIASAARTVSVISTVAAGSAVVRATRALGGSRWLALSLFAGAYSATGFWYDLDRSDSLCVALLAGGFVVALEATSRTRLAIAGALLGLAFLAKQPAMVFIGLAGAALIFSRRVRDGVALLAGASVVIIPSVAWLTLSTDGWFWFYCLKMPASHGFDASLITVYFVLDASKTFALFGASITVVAMLVPKLRKLERSDVLFAAFVAAGFLVSASSRLHRGGYVNTLIFLTTFGAIAFAVLAARAAALRVPVLDAVVAGIAIAQLVHFLYDPSDALASPRQIEAASKLDAHIHELERAGDVIVIGRSHVTAHPHFHVMALTDVLRAGKPLPDDLARGLASQKYAAYVIDDPKELSLEEFLGRGQKSPLYGMILRNYYFAERFDDRAPKPVVGANERPTWVLRPRKVPLDAFTDDQLARRAKIEIGLCEMRMRLAQAGGSLDDGADIETRAATTEMTF